jgi:hypothetical protein
MPRKRVCSVVRLMFPGVAERFLKSAEWHKEKHGIEPLFGLFWNFRINGLFPGQKRVHCLPHADAKNIVGVCVLVVYQLPGMFSLSISRISSLFKDVASIVIGYKFNHRKRTWLVVYEAGVAIELPPWMVTAYPSSLLFHFNLDITGKCSLALNSNLNI